MKKHYPKTTAVVLLFIILSALAHLVPFIGPLLASFLAIVGVVVGSAVAILETAENAQLMEEVKMGLRAILGILLVLSVGAV